MLLGFLASVIVVVDYVVVLVLEGLPRLWYRLHQPLLGDPHEFTVNRVFGVHAKEASIVLNFGILRRSL